MPSSAWFSEELESLRVRRLERWLDWWERSFQREGDYAEAVSYADDMEVLTTPLK